jgi:manganese/zinc/iron transport system permease protein
MNYFTDAVLRAPTLGSMCIGIMAALVGVPVVLRRSSLIGETLSHSAYPGVMLGVLLWGFLGIDQPITIQLLLLTLAFCTSVLAYKAVLELESKLRVPADSALCFVLSAFFGIGVFIASIVQFQFSSLYNLAQTYLFGQAATLTDLQLVLYLFLAFLCAALLAYFYRPIKIYLFDPSFAKVLGISTKPIELLLLFLTALALVVGIRAVGVVLMAALMIAPAVAARALTHHLGSLLGLSCIFGALFALLGTILSNELTLYLSQESRVSVPTGPTIVIVAAFITFLILLFNPNNGLLFRIWRQRRFKSQTLKENILKTILRRKAPLSFDELKDYLYVRSFSLSRALSSLVKQGWITISNQSYHLTQEGELKAKRIQRLHRLWEVYLVDYVGLNKDRVHKSAEEMEHLITPELERELTKLLKDPTHDPHEQPIPPDEESL